jgi:long-chain fatty acid transport protein
MSRDVRLICLTVVSVASALLAGRSARATSTMELVGATTGGNQFTARLFSRSSAATYFNPSLLPEATPKLEIGVFAVAVQNTIRLAARPYGVDVPTSVYGTNPPSYDGPNAPVRPLATQDLAFPRSDTTGGNSVSYAAIGLVRPLAGKSLVFGLHALLPVRSFLDQKSFFVDEREQFFSNQLHPELLGDRLNVSSITFALGSQLNDWISIGAGIDIAIFTETKTAVYVPDASDQSRALLAPDIHTNSKFKPYFAATTHPTGRSSVVATAHFPVSNDMEGANNIRFWNYTYPAGQNSVPQVYSISQGYEPLRIAVGGSYGGMRMPDGRQPWELGVQVLGERWSQYHNRQGARPLDAWKDTIRVTAGGGFLWRDRHITADLGYIPSPVPPQTGRTNYVDNARWIMSLGIEGPVKFLGQDLEAGISRRRRVSRRRRGPAHRAASRRCHRPADQ